MCAGYALSLLGTGFEHPSHAVHDMPVRTLLDGLDALPSDRQTWPTGAFVDAIGTAYHLNLTEFGLRAESTEALLGWLLAKADPRHGMWRTPDRRSGLHQLVNRSYRLTHGTFAQLGLPLPYPERAIDTLLAHVRDGT